MKVLFLECLIGLSIISRMGLYLYGPNNEMLDVDFHDEEAKTIDPYFFTKRILNLKLYHSPKKVS